MALFEDGTGTGSKAKITTENLLRVHAFTESFDNFALLNGNSFNVNTGVITLTNATETPVLYIANTSDNDDLVITRFLWLIRGTTGGSGDVTVDIYKNITGGTIVSGASAVSMASSKNVGSGASIPGNVYKGATGNTYTGGTLIVSTQTTSSTATSITTGTPVIPPGNNVCVTYTPPTSNTSQDAMFIADVFVRKVKL